MNKNLVNIANTKIITNKNTKILSSNNYFFGRIEIICGSMFSGKTEELIRRINRAVISKKKVAIFKPHTDNRYSLEHVVSHNNQKIEAISVSNAQSILLLSNDMDVIGIDEAQFFNSEIVFVCQELAKNNKRVIIAGLDMDYECNPFGHMPELMAIADEVLKVHAICMQCGEIAAFSKRLVSQKSKILIGEKNYYEPRCRKCYYL